MITKPRFSTVTALILGLACLGPACSKSDPYFLLVNVSLQSNVPAPDTVQLTASQNGTKLKQSTVAWPASKPGPIQVGLGLPSGITGTVLVDGIALRNGLAVGEGSLSAIGVEQGKNNGPFPLLLIPVSAGGTDGGTDGSANATVDGSTTGETNGTGGTGGSADLDAGAKGGATSTGGAATGGAPGTGGEATGGALSTGGATFADAATDVRSGAPDVVPVDAAKDAATDTPVFLDVAHADGPSPDVSPDVFSLPDSSTRQWSATRNVQNNPGSSSYPTPKVAVSPTTGDAVVAWVDGNLGVQVVHYSAATDQWDGTPTTLDSRGRPDGVQVAVDGTGHYVAVWSQLDQTLTPLALGIWASYSSDGVTWSKAPVLLAAGPANAYYGDVRVAMNRTGQAWVVWDQGTSPISSSSAPEWVYAVYLSGTTAKPAIIVKAGTNDYSTDRYPRVAIDSKGNGLVVWNELDGNPAVNNTSTWAAALADGTTPAPMLIENYDADITLGADVAMNADGQAVAVWAQRTTSGGYTMADVFARRYGVGTGWETPQPLLYHASYSGDLSVDEDRTGAVSLAWSQPSTGGDYQAMFSTQSLAGTWSSAYLETDDLAPGYTTTDIQPEVRTALTSGDVLLSWRKRLDGSTFAPHFRWRHNGAWGAESEVGKIANLYASEIHTGTADDGRAVAAWTYYHCYYDSIHPDKCSDVPLTSLPASSKAALANVFVAVYK